MLFLLAIISILSLSVRDVAGVDATGVTTQGTVYRTANVSPDGQTLLLGALFPIHTAGTNQPCGSLRTSAVQTVESMVLAIRIINEDPNLLPNVTLAFDIRDTCLSVNYALQQSVDYIQSTNSNCTNRQALGLSAVLGAFQSTISEAVANLYGLFQIPQVSYGSSSTVLSDINRYRYFFRTIPSDLFQAAALVDIVIRFKWQYLITLHSGDLYGSGGIEAFRMELQRRNVSVNCIATQIAIRLTPPFNYREAVDAMSQPWVRNASVVLLFGHLETAIGILDEIRVRVNDDPAFPLQNLTWIGTDSWGDNLPDKYRPMVRGMLSTVPRSGVIPIFNDYFMSLNPRNYTENPWFVEYWETVFGCNLGLSPNLTACNVDSQTISFNTSSYSQFSLVPLVFDAVYTVAHSVQDLIKARCPSGDLCPEILSGAAVDGVLLRESILNVSFLSHDQARRSVSFDRNGDVRGEYSILNLQSTVNNQHVFATVGTWGVVNGLLIRDGDIEWVEGNRAPKSVCNTPCQEGEVRRLVPNVAGCCFRCVACDNNTAVVGDQCRICGIGTQPNRNHSSCVQIPITFLTWSNPWAVTLITLTCIGFIATMCVIIIFLVYIKHEFIKASSRELSAILLGGILLCYIIPFFYIAKPSPAICAIRRFGVGFCFSVSYSALLVKINRIHRIFNRNPNSPAKNLKFVSPLSQVLFTGIFVAIQVLIAVVWLSVEPPHIQVKPSANSNELRCGSSPLIGLSVSLGYNFVLLIISTYFAFLTRKVPANFNEAKYVNVTLYSICIIWLAFVPTYFATAGLGTLFQTTTLVFGIIFSAATTLCCLFISKVIILNSRIRKKKRAESLSHTQSQNAVVTEHGGTVESIRL